MLIPQQVRTPGSANTNDWLTTPRWCWPTSSTTIRIRCCMSASPTTAACSPLAPRMASFSWVCLRHRYRLLVIYSLAFVDLELVLPGHREILARHEEVQLEIHAVFAVQPERHSAPGLRSAFRFAAFDVGRDSRLHRHGGLASALPNDESAIRHLRNVVQWPAPDFWRFALAGAPRQQLRFDPEQGRPRGRLRA